MRFKFICFAGICFFICFFSCQKKPEKGEYKGIFVGIYETDTSSAIYTTIYYFDITYSTKKELRLKENLSQITSVLKKYEKDSISGMIGFGGVYKPNSNSSFRFNTISIRGKYNKRSIEGTFFTTFGYGNKEYLSEGIFTLSSEKK